MPKINYLFTNYNLILFFYMDNIVVLYYLEYKVIFLKFKAALLAIYKIRSLRNLS